MEVKKVNIRRNTVLMLYPSAIEVEQKCDVNSFWKREWKRIKDDINDFKTYLEYVFKAN